MDHRCGSRVPFVADITIRHHEYPELVCASKDLSHEGICIVADNPRWPLHSVVELEICLPDSLSASSLTLHAMLVYEDKNCLGFMFTQLDEGMQQIIDDCIEQIRRKV